jgi:hypothetical protein
MKIFAVCMTKDSEDIIYHFVTHALEEGLDGIIIANNLSTDNTQQELEKVKTLMKGSACEVIIVQDNEVGYYQSRKTTDLAHMARLQFGAEWVIPMDDDEIWFANGGRIADIIKELPDNVDVLNADLYNHFPTALDEPGIIPFETIAWRQKQKGALPKVAVRYHPDMIIGQGNHGVSLPFKPVVYKGILEIRHFPYRSWPQFLRKAQNGAKAYNATNLPKDMGAHWRGYGELLEKWGEDVLRTNVFERYFWFFSPLDNEMMLDPAPFRRWNH